MATLAKIVVPEGTSDVPVNQLIAVMAEEGEDVKAAAAGAGRRAVAEPASSPPSPPRGEGAPSKPLRLRSRLLCFKRGESSTSAVSATRSLSPAGRGSG